jgi:ABC-type glutathione transport system ATPase component
MQRKKKTKTKEKETQEKNAVAGIRDIAKRARYSNRREVRTVDSVTFAFADSTTTAAL